MPPLCVIQAPMSEWSTEDLCISGAPFYVAFSIHVLCGVACNITITHDCVRQVTSSQHILIVCQHLLP